MQRERRRDPYPWTWEPWVAGAFCVGLMSVIGIQVARGVANLLAGAGWTWPATDAAPGGFSSPLGTAFWTSLPGIVTGHADAGLPTPVPADIAGPGLLWSSITLTEMALLASVVWGIVYVYHRWGPGRMRGMASASEAEKGLGITRLRKVAPVVRPDVYGKHAPDPAPVQRVAGEAGDATAQPGSPLGRGLNPWLLERRAPKEKETSR